MKQIAAIATSLVLASTVTASCSRGLSHDEAKRIVESSAQVHPSKDNIAVEAISSPSPAEAIVRATIAGHTTNLKFRRYDTGWKWEFVETTGGGWIAPDQAIAQIREANRKTHAQGWAGQHRKEYASTIDAVDTLTSEMPGSHQTFDVASWMKMRTLIANLLDASVKNPAMIVSAESRTPEALEKRAAKARLLRDIAVKDSWGRELLLHFDAGERQLLLMSLGPDGQKSTPDDVVCLTKGRRTIEDGELNWTYDKTWQVPEGLDEVIADKVKKPFHAVEYAKVVVE